MRVMLYSFSVHFNHLSSYKIVWYFRNGRILDTKNQIMGYYEEAPKVLEKLYNEGYILAAVSRTKDPTGVAQLLKLFTWDRFFTYTELYPEPKVAHFERYVILCTFYEIPRCYSYGRFYVLHSLNHSSTNKHISIWSCELRNLYGKCR